MDEALIQEQDFPVESNEDGDANPKWLPERLERARRGAVQGLLDELGFADVDALREALTTGAESVTQLTAERDTALAQAADAESARRQAIIDAAFWVEAGKYDFINLDEARTFVDLSAVEIAEENAVIGMSEAVAALVEARPHLVRRRPIAQTDSRRSGEKNGMQPQTVDDLSPEQIDDIRRRFKLW